MFNAAEFSKSMTRFNEEINQTIKNFDNLQSSGAKLYGLQQAAITMRPELQSQFKQERAETEVYGAQYDIAKAQATGTKKGSPERKFAEKKAKEYKASMDILSEKYANAKPVSGWRQTGLNVAAGVGGGGSILENALGGIPVVGDALKSLVGGITRMAGIAAAGALDYSKTQYQARTEVEIETARQAGGVGAAKIVEAKTKKEMDAQSISMKTWDSLTDVYAQSGIQMSKGAQAYTMMASRAYAKRKTEFTQRGQEMMSAMGKATEGPGKSAVEGNIDELISALKELTGKMSDKGNTGGGQE
jgi:hypothetical protein